MFEDDIARAPLTLSGWQRQWAARPGPAIDLGLARMHAALQRLQLKPPVVVTVAGTNGKGSVCAMVESLLRQAGYRVGLYLSPPLVSLAETVRIDGAAVDEAVLCQALARAAAVQPDATWFELCTLAAWIMFAAAPLDAWVLEVGLGGRLDAVNALDADVAAITSIALDHTDLLGPDREAIGREKAGIARAGRPLVVGDPLPPASVAETAAALGATLWQIGRDFTHQGDAQQWRWQGRHRRYAGLAYPALRGANQLLNASTALAVCEALHERLPITAQAVRTGFALVELPGRFQIVPGQPALVLDVAHNPQAVAVLAQNLDQMGFYPSTHAVFGAMRDKDIAGLLPAIAPLVDRWYLTDLPLPRAATAAELAVQLRALPGPRERPFTAHADPAEALRAAAAAADPADRIVVFGSFHTVGGVLKDGLPRLAARHLG